MGERPAFVAWLDLETAGTDEHDPILEVGVVLCRNEPDMPIVSERAWVPRMGEAELAVVRASAPPVVADMHDHNGPWRDLGAAVHDDTAPDLGMVDYRCSEWLRSTCGSSHVALAGSGVSHFDRRFIRAQMPRTDRRLTHWAYDVGVVRRLLELANPDAVRPLPDGGKAHRALDDARDHRAEWVHYSTAIAEAVA